MSSRNLLSLSDIWMMSPEMLIHVSLLFGRQPSRFQKMTNTAHVQHTMKNTVTISHRNFQPVMQFGSQISYCHISQPRTYLTVASFVDVDGRPLRGSSSMVSRPSRKRLCQSSTWNCLIALSPYGCCKMIDIQLVISAAKHKILYSSVVKLQKFTPTARPHAH